MRKIIINILVFMVIIVSLFLCGCIPLLIGAGAGVGVGAVSHPKPKMIRLEPTPYIPYEKSEPKITYVFKDSEAEKAGFKIGDLILEVEGYKIEHPGWAYTKLKDLSDANKEGIVKIRRKEQVVDIRFRPHKADKYSFGMLLSGEHYTVDPGKGLLRADLVAKDGINIAVCGLTAENSPIASMLLVIQNFTDKNIAIYPSDILVLDGYNTILKIYGGQVIAAGVQERAEQRYGAAKERYSSSINYAQSLPPSYTISGSTTEFGNLNGNARGTLYTYSNYGQYTGTYTSTYTGSSQSHYTITPQPNIMASAMLLGSALSMAAERNRYQEGQELSGELSMDAFEFGAIPAETNRKGSLYCEIPRSWPLQIRIRLNNKEYLLKLDKPKEDMK